MERAPLRAWQRMMITVASSFHGSMPSTGSTTTSAAA